MVFASAKQARLEILADGEGLPDDPVDHAEIIAIRERRAIAPGVLQDILDSICESERNRLGGASK